MDLGKAPGPTDTLQTDNQGCASGTPITTITGTTSTQGVFVTSNSGGGDPVLADQHILVEVTMGQSFTGNLNNITIDFTP